MSAQVEIGQKSIYDNPEMVRDSQRISEQRKKRTRRKSEIKALRDAMRDKEKAPTPQD